jgi:hypothetical protein
MGAYWKPAQDQVGAIVRRSPVVSVVVMVRQPFWMMPMPMRTLAPAWNEIGLNDGILGLKLMFKRRTVDWSRANNRTEGPNRRRGKYPGQNHPHGLSSFYCAR